MDEGVGQKPKKSNRKWLEIGVGLLVVVALVGAGVVLYSKRAVSPVPKNIQVAASFPIYYPDQKKLPAGYMLDLNSFQSPRKNAVVYHVTYGNGQVMVFSVQPKPSDQTLTTFNSSYIPLHTPYQTNVGTAQLSAYNNGGKTPETLVSLPTNGPTWLIITAPYNINQAQLKQVLQAIKQ